MWQKLVNRIPNSCPHFLGRVTTDLKTRNPCPTSIYGRTCDYSSPMDYGCSDVIDAAIDDAIDDEAIGDGRALKREAGSLITAWKGSREAAP